MNKGLNFYRNCGVALLGEWKTNICRALSTDRADIQVLEPGISPGFYFHVKQKKNM